jgi:nucleoid-associated protein YgaU
MGLFDFVKNAGTKIFGQDKDEPKPGPTPTQDDAVRHDRWVAARLVKIVEGLGLEVVDLSIKVDGYTATVKGQVESQADKEKVVLAVGNVEGIERVDDQLTVQRPEPEASFYTVQKGDTLSKIAKEHYGNANQYGAIFEANRPLLEHPDRIYPGQVLRIPPLAR